MSDAAFDQLDAVDDRLDELSAALEPLLSKTVADHATSLPVADKARLYVLTTYAVESLLFSYLRLTGQPTKDHAVMRELTRVRQYVAKIKEAEPAAPPTLSLDKAAAGRFIAAALAGNDKYDEERAATIARERAGAEAKLKALDEKRKREEGSEESEKVTKKSKKEETGEEEVKKKKKKTKRSKEEKEARREERREKRKDVHKKQMSAS